MKTILLNYKKIAKHLAYLAIALLVGSAVAYAGSLTPPGAPADTMYTLDGIYNLASGATTTVGTGSLPSTPGSASPTFHTLTQIYTAISGQIGNLSSSTIATGTTAFGIVGTRVPAKILQEFGTSDYCSDANGLVTSCAGTGLAGQYLSGQPRSYTDNSDGTISDNATGLTWQKCQYGLSGSSCVTGTASSTQLSIATSTCMTLNLGGKTDWRLPNRFELESLITTENQLPTLTNTYFPNTSTAVVYWTSTVRAVNPAQMITVNFSDGTVGVSTRTNVAYMRCVRG